MKSFYLPFFLCLLISGFSAAQESRPVDLLREGFSKNTETGQYAGQILRETECDTVRFPLSGEITYYYLMQPESGYVTGNNSYKDKVKAEYFSTFETGSFITGIVAEFAVAKSHSNPDVVFGIWDNTGTNGKPGVMVALASKPLNSIVSDVQYERITTVTFQEPYPVNGPYYVGVVLPQNLGDTVALWCRKHVEGYSGTAWDQWSDGRWFAFSDPSNWGNSMLTTMTLHPIVCKTTGISEPSDAGVAISPNPSTGVINIKRWKSSEMVSMNIYSAEGKMVYSRAFPGAVTDYNIDLGILPRGIYYMALRDSRHNHLSKLILQ